jgi:uncharacterized membrane protein
MIALLAGLMLWSLVHFSRSLVPQFRQHLIAKLGLTAYKAIFAGVVLLSLVLMVYGWKATPPELLYPTPSYSKHITALVMAVAMVFFLAARAPTNLKRYWRHPQLMGVVMWSLAHLASNGDLRSVLLFVGLGSWAVVQIVLINRREGKWVRPAKQALRGDLALAVISVTIYAVFVLGLHQWLFGVRPY